MTRLCPTRGRRHRPKRRTAQAAGPAPPVRIVLLDGCRDAEGQPRPALLIPGRRHPTVFPTMHAALACKARLEGIAR